MLASPETCSRLVSWSSSRLNVRAADWTTGPVHNAHAGMGLSDCQPIAKWRARPQHEVAFLGERYGTGTGICERLEREILQDCGLKPRDAMSPNEADQLCYLTGINDHVIEQAALVAYLTEHTCPVAVGREG